MNTVYRWIAAFAAAALLAGSAWAGPAEDVARMQQGWEQIKYGTPAARQEAEFARLLADSEQMAARNPGNADVLIWYAIVESTYAGAKGGLGALKYVKNARKSLERALALDPNALNGSAYTSLGSLYYQVPGWPIGFGDKTRAEEFLKKGLAVNPDGIDPNYFYGDYLLRQGDYSNAERYLRKALQAPARPGRKLADEGRRGEIRELLNKIAEGKK
ncbi:TRAP transporter TatT component family protein [Massilia sp. UBA6681]|uniref:TRAP transporter TatT component family protein n=1 Tax=Massilia sp. UBA6681 TaxID=1946839 RepID=UPI0025B89EED|nr:TRAP transporter TatT component family protein [Massilia sp. UBA6681]